MTKKLSDEVVDFRLKQKNLKRIGNYINSSSNMTVECLKCNLVWNPLLSDIFSNGSGCPRCAGLLKLDNETVDLKLEKLNKNIKRLGNYINAKTKIEFCCNNCNLIWLAAPGNILNGGRGCPKCSKKLKLTNDVVDERLIGKNIRRIDDYFNSKTKLQFQCLKCEYIWKAIPSAILKLNHNTGCPFCNIRKNEKLIYSILLERSIKFESQKLLSQIFKMKNNKKIFVDFYFPELNFIIEYNGAQHYGPIRFGNISKDEADKKFKLQKERDKILIKLCKKNKVKLIIIDGRSFYGEKLNNYIIEIIGKKIICQK